eukprot:gene724-biopygen8691
MNPTASETALGDGVLQAMLQAMLHPGLMALDASECGDVDDAAVVSVGQRCPLLHTLSLDEWCNLTDAAVLSVGQGCPQLHTLSLDGCRNLT